VEFREPILFGNENDFIDFFAVRECFERMPDDRFAGERRKEFVEAHAAGTPGSNDDCADHYECGGEAE
jgi:hypothetical protein